MSGNDVLPPRVRAFYPFSGHTCVTGGSRMHYVDTGSGMPVLMVHGNPTWSFFYRDLIRDLASTHRCIAPDHIGCGLSAKPERHDYTLAGRIDDLEQLVDNLGLERFHLVVHDWGGAIGMGLAVRNPARIGRIVIMNTAAFPMARIPLRIALCRTPWLGALAVRGFNAFAGAATFMTTVKRLPPEVREGYLFPYRSWSDRVAVLRFVQDIPMRPDHPSYATLEAIGEGIRRLSGRPMLVCWGLRDWCFNAHFLSEWKLRFPSAQVCARDDAGHYLLEDQFDIFAPRIRAFLA